MIAACVIESDAVVRAHAVQMPTRHDRFSMPMTIKIMAVEIHGIAATIRVQVRGVAAAAAKLRYMAALVVHPDGATSCTPTTAA